jgi:hypothetical protein
MQGLRSKRHVVYSLYLHLVFVTKYRKKIFSDLMIKRMKYHFQRVCKDFGCRLIESNAEMDIVKEYFQNQNLSAYIQSVNELVLRTGWINPESRIITFMNCCFRGTSLTDRNIPS